jgi:putative glycosyltransferase (TIGR04372 family)
MQFAARLVELGHPSKIWLLEEIVKLNPSHLMAYQQLGISHYHDSSFAQARAVWAAGLDKRDELAQQSGLAQSPFRLLDASWYQAVGHIALLDTFIKARKLGWLEEKPLYLLRVAGRSTVNQSYLDYWRSYVEMPKPDAEGDNLAETARITGLKLKQFSQVTEPLWATKRSDGKTLWHMEFAAAVQREWESRGGAPLLTLNEQDDAFGRATLAELGMPADAWFACFHVREPGFWWKWNRLHASTRDADIETYVQAMQAVVARGGWVLRMGDASMKSLPAIPGVIDYAHSAHKSERMDVYLSARCRFFVGVNSGLSLLPPTFGRPCVLTNFVPISVPLPYSADIIVPKLFSRRGKEGYMTVEELFASKLADMQFADRIPEDVDVIDNDPQEICEAVLEMMDELDGKHGTADCDEVQRLRSRYDAIVLKHKGFLGSRVGGRFLLRHPELV